MSKHERLSNFMGVYYDKENFQLGIMKDDKFVPSSDLGRESLYVAAYGGVTSALRNLYRASAIALLHQVNHVLGIGSKESRNNFVNGGTYANGVFVEETIIYKPYHYGGYGSHPAHYGEAQSIFTFRTAYWEEGARGNDMCIVYDLNEQVKNLRVKGMALQEDSNHFFDKVLAPVETWQPWHTEWLRKDFNIKEEDEASFICVDSSWFTLIEVAADLIKKHYFEGNDYLTQRNKHMAIVEELKKANVS